MDHVTETSSGKLDRKTVERNRRIHMKNLCGKLVSLIPPQHLQPAPRELVSQQDQLDQAVTYIKQLKEGVEKLKSKKRKLVRAAGKEEEEEEEEERGSGSASAAASLKLLKAPNNPIVEVRDLGSSLEVNLISCCTTNFMLHQVIKIVEEEGGEVVSAIFSAIGDKVFYTLHAQVKVTRLGMNTLGVYERLKKLIISQLPAR